MKKIVALLLTVVLTATAAIGGTVAYFTDTEDVTNTMTVGKVDVSLVEKQRNEDGTALIDFAQNKEITPLVGAAQGEKDNYGMPVAENYIDKIVYATNNTGKDAYIRFLVAIPVGLIPDANDDQAPLHWNFGNRVDITGKSKYNTVAYADSDWAKQFTYGDVKADGTAAKVTINGVEHWVTVFTMKEALAGNATSLAVMAGLYLDNAVDYDDEKGYYTYKDTKIDYDFSNGIKIPVLLQAVQTDGWEATDDKAVYDVAFDTAFGELTVANAEKWFTEANK